MNPSAKRDRLRSLLPASTLQMVPDVRWVGECGSTNTILADEARTNSVLPKAQIPNAVLIADRQTAGKGRLGRSWESEIDTSLTMSLRFTTPTDAQILGLLPLAVGLAAHQCIVLEPVTRARVELKWPNDLMDAQTGRKLAGILCEAVPLADGSAVIAGIGVNVNKPPNVDGVFAERAQWLSELVPPETRNKIDLVQLAADLIIGIVSIVAVLQRTPEVVIAGARENCATVGRRVRIEQVNETWTGLATGIDGSGGLIVERDVPGEKRETIVHAADVVHLRMDDVS